MILTCADDGELAEHLVWSTWGPAQATASGIVTWHVCTPNCAESTKWDSAKADITLTDPEAAKGKDVLFTKLTLHTISPTPAAFMRNLVFSMAPLAASSAPLRPVKRAVRLPVAAPSGSLSYAAIEGYWIYAGGATGSAGSYTVPQVAAAITGAESSFLPGIIQQGVDYCGAGSNRAGWGLWQITCGNSVAQYGTNFQILDPWNNAEAAVYKYNAAGGFSPWSTYASGAYQRYLLHTSPGTDLSDPGEYVQRGSTPLGTPSSPPPAPGSTYGPPIYSGDIVQWSGDTKAQKTAWRVGADGRRHWIPSISDYWCLKNGGVPGPFPLSSAVLDTVVPDDTGSQAPCGGDFNGDGLVNIVDLSVLLSQWGTPRPKSADSNLDGTVNIFDLSILLSQWGKKPTPAAVKAPAAGAALQPAARTGHTARAVPVKLARPRLVSRAVGLGGNDVSADSSVSADGGIVAFSSLASNLVAGDANGVLDVFAWNRSAGTVTLISVDANGNQFGTPSTDARVSPNGRYVAFDNGGDVYVKDLQTGALERISQPNSDPAGEPDQAAYADGVTSSGLVVFESKATNLVAGDTNGASDVFVRQLQDAPIEQVSVGSDAAGGAEGNADSYAGAASDDGQYVVFVSRATNLAANNTNGQAGIFVRDLAAGVTTLVSGPPGGGQADGDAGFPSVSISANGPLVAFNSDATNLAAGNPNGHQQVYVQNLAADTLERASQTNGGTAGNGDSTEPALSGDGSRVAFRSVATNLATGDTNHADDVFVQDLAGHLISRVSVTPKLAQGNSSSFGPSLNNDGTIIAFPSDATNLTGSAAGTPEQIVALDITQLPLSGATPTITGTAKVGDTLTAHPGKWGPSGVQLQYQWYASGTAITGATTATLNLAAAQQGKRITVKVTASLAGYATATATSKATVKVVA